MTLPATSEGIPCSQIGRFDVLLCQNVGKQRQTWHEGSLTINNKTAVLYSRGMPMGKMRAGPPSELCFVFSARQWVTIPSGRDADELAMHSPSALYLRMLSDGIAVGSEFALSSSIAVQIVSVKAHPLSSRGTYASPAPSETAAPPVKVRRAESSLHKIVSLPIPAPLVTASPVPDNSSSAAHMPTPQSANYLTSFYATRKSMLAQELPTATTSSVSVSPPNFPRTQSNDTPTPAPTARISMEDVLARWAKQG